MTISIQSYNRIVWQRDFIVLDIITEPGFDNAHNIWITCYMYVYVYVLQSSLTTKVKLESVLTNIVACR